MMPFHVQYASEIRIGITTACILVFYVFYALVAPFRGLVDKGVRPSVSGLTDAYGTLSSFVHRTTGLNLGFVKQEPDKDFIFRVQLATYVNERQAQPIIDIATDQLKSREQREQALKSLLKLPSHADWIRPFLNDLPKGGMIGLYDEQSPVLDEIIRQIRLEGGIQKPLIRAYAEVSLSFLLQVPQDILRKKGVGWVSDVLPDEALFLIVPRINREVNKDVQEKISLALWDIRAVSNRSRALEILKPIYNKPPWPSLKLPVAIILARLGERSILAYIHSRFDKEDFSSVQQTSMRLALARTPYPLQIKASENIELVRRERENARRRHHQEALAKQKEIRAQMAAATAATAVAALPVQQPAKAPFKPPVAEQPAVVPPTAEQPPVKQPPVTQPPVKKPTVPVAPVPVEEPVEEEVIPRESLEDLPYEDEVVEEPKKPESNMRYVDIIFEVKEAPAALYADAGDESPSGVSLPVGSKGKASFEVLINDEKWYQVKSKEKTGWAKASDIKIYDLSPVDETPVAPSAPAAVESSDRQEATYFEVLDEGILARAKPTDASAQVAPLSVGKAYLAVKSEKIGADRWFLLKLENGKEGWVAGIDLQLAEVPAPVREESRNTQREIKSAFKAEWVVAGVEGVLVYDRASIAGNVLQKISPPIIYEVLETHEGGMGEWYKIKLSSKKARDGWVQSMDVNLTSKP